MKVFPSEFLWGAALSAHAVEGGHFASDWWRWEQRPGRIADGSTSQAGSEHWERFREDIGLARKFGLNALLVSLEWSRIEPRPNEVHRPALDHYRLVLETMRDAGIEPLVALQEITLPQWLAAGGGWADKGSAEAFARYVRTVGESLGNACRYWIPLMIPGHVVRMGYLWELWPPGRHSLRAGWKSLRHLALAHAEAFRALREKSPSARIGASVLAERLHPFDLSSTWDLRAARWERALSTTVWLRALTTGQWPRPFGKNPALADTVDFIGVSYYGAQHVRFRPGLGKFSVRVNAQGERTSPHDYEKEVRGLNDSLSDLTPFGKPFIILGNGTATDEDSVRCHYLLDHVAALHRAVDAGLDARGYIHRSLLDGFEWDRGYKARYGLIHVGRDTMTRTPNTSAFLYKDITESGRIRKGAVARYSPGWHPPESIELT